VVVITSFPWRRADVEVENRLFLPLCFYVVFILLLYFCPFCHCKCFTSKYSQKCIFYSWSAVSALRALSVLFRTLLGVTARAVMSCRTNKVIDYFHLTLSLGVFRCEYLNAIYLTENWFWAICW